LFQLVYSGDDPFSVIKDRDTSGEESANAVDRDSITEDRSTWGRPKVEVLYDVANDGQAETNVARIVNRLPLRYFDGRIKFLMRQGDYRVTGGTVLAQYDYDCNGGSSSDGDGGGGVGGSGSGGCGDMNSNGSGIGSGAGGYGNGEVGNGGGFRGKSNDVGMNSGSDCDGDKIRTAVLVKVEIQPGQPDQRLESITTVTISHT
jgi:hypothetical protein